MLATFAGAPFGERAARLAVESAAEMRSTLLIVEMLEARSRRGRAAAASKPLGAGLAAGLPAVKALAAELSVEVEAVRVSSPQPVAAMLGFVKDRMPALVVFATDPAALRRFGRPSRRQHRRFVAALAEHADCLIWTAQEPDARAARAAARRARRAAAASMRAVRAAEVLGVPRPSPAGGAAG